MDGDQNHTTAGSVSHKLADYLAANEERLMDKVLAYAIAHGYTKYTSTLKEAWRVSISGLTESMAGALTTRDFVAELGLDQACRSDPVAAFAIVEARRHRQRGIPLEMFMGLLKYYRQSYQDVVREDDDLADDEKRDWSHLLNRLFDRIEIGFCTEWSASAATHLDELQASNRAMTNEKNKYLTIFESLPFPVFLLDARHAVDNLNHAATRWLGGHSIPGAHYYATRCEAMPEDQCRALGATADRRLPAWLQPEVDAFSDDDTRRYHYFEKDVGEDDDQRIYFVQLSRMLDVSGKFTGSVVMVQDFTDVRKAEEERARMKEQLLQSDKMASIGQLAAGVAHEINNPIGFIASNLNRLNEYAADMIRMIDTGNRLVETIGAGGCGEAEITSAASRVRQVASDIDLSFVCEDVRDVIAECKEGADRVRQIVADLKDFAHPGISDPQPADINRCIDSTLNMLKSELKYKATLSKTFGEIPPVLCHPRQINQVLMNIIVNAAQAIEKKGEIAIVTQPFGDAVRIQISDTGCGMTQDQAKRIFEPFYTTKPVGTGTGLGLHIAYQIIQQHQGRITVASRPGKGTTFTIHLPLNPHLGETDGTAETGPVSTQ